MKKKPEAKKLIKTPDHLVPVWDKNAHIKKRLNERPVEFYIRNYRLNLNISLVICLMTFFVMMFASSVIVEQQKNNSVEVTRTDGRMKSIELTNEDVAKMQIAFEKLKNK